MKLYGLLLFIIAQQNGFVESTVDCKQNVQLEDMDKCCQLPQPQWSAFESQCGQFNIPNQPQPSACLLECVFPTAEILKDNELNMESVQAIVHKLLPGNEVFSLAYTAGFEKCASKVKSTIEGMKAANHWPVVSGSANAQCTLNSIFYTICAHKNLIVHCPASAWTTTPACEHTKEFLTTCNENFGVLDMKGRVRRDAAEEMIIDPYPFESIEFLI